MTVRKAFLYSGNPKALAFKFFCQSEFAVWFCAWVLSNNLFFRTGSDKSTFTTIYSTFSPLQLSFYNVFHISTPLHTSSQQPLQSLVDEDPIRVLHSANPCKKSSRKEQHSWLVCTREWTAELPMLHSIFILQILKLAWTDSH